VKAIKWMSFVAAGLWATLMLASIVLTGSFPLRLAIRVSLNIASLVLLLISVFGRKPALGYIGVGIKITVIVYSMARNIMIYDIRADVMYILNVFLQEGMALALWVLWLFALKNKAVAIITMVLSALLALWQFGLIASVLTSDLLGTFLRIYIGIAVDYVSVVFYYLSVALTALWLILRKKEAVPAPEALPAAGPEL